MIKKIFALVILIVMLPCSLAAEGESPEISGMVLQDFTIDGIKADSSYRLVLRQDVFDSFIHIRDVLNGELSLQELILNNSGSVVNYAGDKQTPKIRIDNSILDISDAVFLTEFKELYVEKDGERIDARNVEVTWEVPSLNPDLGSIYVLHYSVNREVYEVIVPKEIDYDNHLITAFFEDLSPVAVFYIKGVNSFSGFYWILIVLLILTGIVIFSRRNKDGKK